MHRRGRPRKKTALYSVQDLVEFNSDSESDSFNIRHNGMYEVGDRLAERSPIRQDRQVQQPRRRQQHHQVERNAQIEPLQPEFEPPMQPPMEPLQPEFEPAMQPPIEPLQPMQPQQEERNAVELLQQDPQEEPNPQVNYTIINGTFA